MADGSHAFNFPAPQHSRLRPGEIVVDLFAGGGGASEALKQALGVDPALAYNHDEWAIGMHAANHPLTIHHREDIWHADPVRDVAGRPVGWFHFSPDCTHFSQAKGGQPRSHKIRALAWVGVKWVGQLSRVGLAPRILSMENVWQMLSWGPLVAKRCRTTGRVIKMDGSVAARGERVPVENQQLVPDKRHAGRTWRQFVCVVRAYGYTVEWRKLVASDYGAGTSRERLFLLARRDGEPITWPEPTHGRRQDQLPVVSAADCLDFSIPCPSIFTRRRPLAEATMRRIAKGVVRHVLNAADPFIIPATQKGDTALIAPTLVQTGYGEREGQSPRALDMKKPLGTVVVGGVKHAIAAAHMVTLRKNMDGSDARNPLRTICAGAEHHAVVAPGLVKFRGDSAGTPVTGPVPTITSGAGAKRPAGAAHALGQFAAFLEQANGGFYEGGGRDARAPMSTITAAGSQQQLVEAELAQLSTEQEAGALQVAAFLLRYYGEGGQWGDLRNPAATITTKDRLALVTVVIQGTPYVIVDIGLRMLKPHELYRAQGFPPGYIIDRTADGRPISTSAAVRMVGNSVSPPPLVALARANLDPARVPDRMAA